MKPEEVTRLLTAALNRDVTLMGQFDIGQEGAFLVDVKRRGRWVLKWCDGEDATAWLQQHQRLNVLLRLARQAGSPIPRRDMPRLVGEIGVLLQEYALGSVSEHVDTVFVDQAADVLDRHRGVALPLEPQLDWGSRVKRVLTGGGYRHSHAGLAENDTRFRTRTKALLTRIRTVGEFVDPGEFPDGDLMHGDYDHSQILRSNGKIEAVVDWGDLAGVGDASFDLVSFTFFLEYAQATPEAEERALQRIEAVTTPNVRAAYWAYMALRFSSFMLDFQRDKPDFETRFERWLSRSEYALDVAEASLGVQHSSTSSRRSELE